MFCGLCAFKAALQRDMSQTKLSTMNPLMYKKQMQKCLYETHTLYKKPGSVSIKYLFV